VPTRSPSPHHEHLFQPGHAETARRILARGWPAGYLAVCVVCGVPVDLVGELRRAAEPVEVHHPGP